MAQLSPDGQRQARRYVCRDTSSRTAYIAGHLFFTEWFLYPQIAFWGEGGPLPPAPGHLDMLGDYYEFPLCVEAYTRGGGKSTIFGKILPLREVVCFPNRQGVVCSATDKLLADKAEPVMIQMEENARLIDDFGPIVPKKGQKRIFNKFHMALLNGAVLKQVSLDSRQLGIRAGFYIMDDPEWDPANRSQERYADLRTKLERFIERDAIYMLRPGHMKFYWVGTMRGARSYLYHVCFSKDAKFKNWTRRIQSGAVLDKDTGEILKSTWKERFPVAHLKFVQGINREAFMTEIMNAPAEEKARLLKVDAIANEYTVDKPPKNLDERNAAHLPDPEALMTYHYFTGYEKDGVTKKWQIDTVNQKEHFSKMLKIATFDYAENNTADSDMKALSITGIDARRTWWRLDLWAGWMRDTPFWEFMIRFCAAWRVDIIAPETIAKQHFLVETIGRRIYDGEAEGLIPRDWNPQIIPVLYPPGLERVKGVRIKTALQYRLDRGGLKFPMNYAHKWPFNEERKQIQFFTVDLSELKRDDIIDADSMVHFVPHGRGTAEPTHGVNPVANMMEAIRRGKPFVEGEEGLVGMPLQNVRQEYLAMLLRKQEEQSQSDMKENSNVWPDPFVIG